MAWLRRMSISTLLVSTLAFEFLFGRVFLQLAHDELTSYPRLLKLLMWTGRFGFLFLSSLTVVLFGAMLFQLFGGEQPFLRRQARLSLLLVGGVLFLCAAQALMFPSSAQFIFQLKWGIVCFGLLIVLALWLTTLRTTAKLGVTFLWTAVLLLLIPSLIPPSKFSIGEIDQIWILAAATAGALALAASERLFQPRLVIAAALWFMAALIVRSMAHDVLSQLSWSVFSVHWPLRMPVVISYLAFWALWMAVLLFLFVGKGRSRMIGMALGLFFFSGLHVERIDVLLLFALAFFIFLRAAQRIPQTKPLAPAV